jgi:osmoprotectant transport system substrate-binding protein
VTADFTRGRVVPGGVAALILTLTCAIAGCGGGGGKARTAPVSSGKPDAGKPPVTLGTRNFTEQLVLGELYAQALRAEGFQVTVKNHPGGPEVIDKALTSGRIDGYPEYDGLMLTAIAHDTRRRASARSTYGAAKAFQERRGFTILDRTPFSDVNALATTSAYARGKRLVQVGDLARLGRFKLGAPPEFGTRVAGLVGMRQRYGISNVVFKPLSIGRQYRALDAGAVQVAGVFATDGRLRSGRYAVLEDPKNAFGFQHVVPVFGKQVLAAEGPVFARTIDAVSAKLTTGAMRQLNAAVELDRNAPADVARRFLRARGLA